MSTWKDKIEEEDDFSRNRGNEFCECIDKKDFEGALSIIREIDKKINVILSGAGQEESKRAELMV